MLHLMRRKSNKILILVFFLYPFFGISSPNPKKIDEIVAEWNKCHNEKDIKGLRELFDERALFYTEEISEDAILAVKSKLLLKPFNQEIVSPIKLQHYTGGIVKCSFQKKVITSRSTKEYPAYLLLEERNGSLLITGESDGITDEKLGFSLNIGEEVYPEKSNNYLLIVLIIITLFLLLLFRFSKQSKNRLISLLTFQNELLIPSKIEIEPLAPPLSTAETNISSSESIAPQPDLSIEREGNKTDFKLESNWEVGYAFEKWVVGKFNQYYFKIMEWRGDKYHEGRGAESNKFPDLELSFTSNTEYERFAIECKWRSNYIDSNIYWAKQTQLVNYKEFEEVSGKKVFVIIGVGGSPNNPKDVYIIPLKEISSIIFHISELLPYKRYRSGEFFFNVNQKTLS